MENQVQLFQNEEFGRIRVLEIDGQPWFILKDICHVLNLSNPTMIAERLDDDEKEILKPKSGLVLDIPNRGLTIVNESGLYAVIIRSDKPEAKKFRRWITNDILPSIRKNGAYITDAVLDEMTRSREFANNLLHRLQSERHKTAALREYIDELTPKARYYDVILQSKTAVQVSILAKEYAKCRYRHFCYYSDKIKMPIFQVITIYKAVHARNIGIFLCQAVKSSYGFLIILKYKYFIRKN